LDSSKGVFETLLVLKGRPIELDWHLERLNQSVRTLYGDVPSPEVADMAVDAARQSSRDIARLRITAHPAEEEIIVMVECEPLANLLCPQPEPNPTHLLITEYPGGIGAHKWRDRSELNNRAQAHGLKGHQELLITDQGQVLEGHRSNVFLVSGDSLITPPLDGRLLPGVARRRVLALAQGAGLDIREATVPIEDLKSADEIFLTGSLRGVEPAVLADEPQRTPFTVTSHLRNLLRDQWQQPF
jgi:para-aminobenzoate synthetase/4-amino-4-deoxychorismate lyase